MAIAPNERINFPRVATDPASVRRRVEAMERLLERLVVIPGINRPVGLDVILDVVPVVGDIIAAGLGAYIVWEAKNVGMSKWQMSRMAGNVGQWHRHPELPGADPVGRSDPGLLLPVKHAQPEDDQAPPRQVSCGRRDRGRPADGSALSDLYLPLA